VLAESLRLAGRTEAALAALDRAAALDPQAPEPALLRARTLRAIGAARRRGSRCAGRSRSRRQQRGQGARWASWRSNGGGRRGRFLPGAIVTADPTDVPALVKLGVARVREGRVDVALALFERAVALDPGNAEALLDLAAPSGKGGRSSAAIPTSSGRSPPGAHHSA